MPIYLPYHSLVAFQAREPKMSQDSSQSSQSQGLLSENEAMTAIRRHCPWEVFRRTWCPKASSVPEELAAFTSTTGGKHMFIPDGTVIPRCSDCKRKKTLACQLDVSLFPAEVKEDIGVSEGLIQSFFCEDWYNCSREPFQNARLVPSSEVNKVKYSLFAQCAKVIMKNDMSIDPLPAHLQSKLNDLHPFTASEHDARESENEDEESGESDRDDPEVIEPTYIDGWSFDALEMPSTNYEIMDLYPIISEKASIPLEQLEDLECKR